MEYIRDPKGRQKIGLRSAAFTQRGQPRNVNQDAIFQWSGQTETGRSIGMYLVCDGVGGHQAGEVASHLAVQTVTAEVAPVFYSANSLSANDYGRTASAKFGDWIRAAITKANSKICRYAHDHPTASNMGTTITLAVIYDRTAHIANVGDSRTYHWRAPQLTQVTHDHSLVASLAELGVIGETEKATHPGSNIILRALGMEHTVEADLFSRQLEPMDKLLLCSDGLWKAFPDPAELGLWFDSPAGPGELCQRLITEAYRRDGLDDSSVIVVTVA